MTAESRDEILERRARAYDSTVRLFDWISWEASAAVSLCGSMVVVMVVGEREREWSGGMNYKVGTSPRFLIGDSPIPAFIL